MSDPMNNRPLDLLDECQSKYGLDRHRKTNRNAFVYYRLCEFDRDSDEWTSSWKLGGIDKDMTAAMTQAFSDIVQYSANAVKQGETILAPICDSIVMVISGHGKHIIRTKDGREWDKMTDEERELAKQEMDPVYTDTLNTDEMVETRMALVITVEGMGREVTMLPKGHDPIVERSEEWTEDGNDTVPSAHNDLDSSLISLFTFVQLINETVRQGREFSIKGVLETATNVPDELGGKDMTAMLLHMISLGIKHGIVDISDLTGSDDDD
jgi:hypothetical protein